MKDSHILHFTPTDFFSAMAAYHAANLTIAFRDADIRDLKRELAKKDERIAALETALQKLINDSNITDN